MTTTKALYMEDVDIGDEVPPVVRRITSEDVRSYLEAWQGPEATKWPSRFHDEEQAEMEGLAGPIVPGPMSMALLSKMLTDWSPTVRLKLIDTIFRQVVTHETEVKIYGVVTDKNEEQQEVEVDLYLEPMEGQPFIRGKAVLGLPSRGS